MIKICISIPYLFRDGLVKSNQFNELKINGLFMLPLSCIESCVPLAGAFWDSLYPAVNHSTRTQ